MQNISYKFDVTEQSKSSFFRLLHVYQQAIDLNIICSITDSEGTIIYTNSKFCEVSKFSKEELIGQNHRIVKSGFHSEAFFKSMWTTINKGEIWQGEVKSKAKDGSYFWSHNTILPVFDQNGVINQFFSMRIPIDEKKQAEEEKRAHILSLEEMLFMTSHRVRQPIVNILGLANQLEDYIHSPDEMLDIVNYMKESALALDTFTKELTKFIYEVKNKEQREKHIGNSL
jgi:PAS domain S-box-containing protein